MVTLLTLTQALKVRVLYSQPAIIRRSSVLDRLFLFLLLCIMLSDLHIKRLTPSGR